MEVEGSKSILYYMHTCIQAAVVGINRLVEQNYTWPDIRDEAIEYCLLLLNSTLGEVTAETMCEPMADNYGPEV